MKRIFAFLLGFILATNLLAQGVSHVVLIAVEDYEDEAFEDLTSTLQDAYRMGSVLQGYMDSGTQPTLLANAGKGVWDEKKKEGYWVPAQGIKGGQCQNEYP